MICRMIHKIKMFFKGIQWFIQRGKRGYSDRDLWCFWDYLCEIIPPAMRWYKENASGCSTGLYDDFAVNDECWRWNLILERIAKGFEAIQELDDDEIDLSEPAKKELKQKFVKGMKLLTKYFRNLSD